MGLDWSSPVFGILAQSSLRAVAVAAIIGGILSALRIRSSAVQHRAWTGALAAMMLMPLLLWIVPATPVPFSTGKFLEKVPAGHVASGAAPIPGNGGEPSAASSGESVSPVPTAPAPRHRSVWPTMILVAYASGIGIFLLRQIVGWRAMDRLMRSARPIGVRGLEALESSALSTAMTCGVLRPRILLPSGWKEWTPAKLRAVVAHERAHIGRHDSLVAFVARLNCAIFWFHPIAWWLERKIAATAEMACDEAVVSETGDPAQYAAVLVEIAEAVHRRGGRVSWHGVGVEGKGILRHRIDRLLNGTSARNVSVGRKTAVAVLCAGTIYLAAACRQQPAVVPAEQAEETVSNGGGTPPAKSPAASPQCQAAPGRAAEQIQGEVSAGKLFSQTTPSGWVLRLAPGAFGWTLEITTQNRPGEDLSRVTPARNLAPNPREIEGWHFRNAANSGPNDGSVNAPSELREFIFSPRVRGNTDYNGASADTVAAIRDFGRGWLHIEEYALSPAHEGPRAAFQRIRFSTCLTWPASEGPPGLDEEDKAIARVRHLRVRDLDPALDNTEFRDWVDWGFPVDYGLNDCGETRPNDADLDAPLCVEARTSTKDGANVSVSIYVGSLQGGVLTAKPSFSSARIERGGRAEVIYYPRRLGEFLALVRKASTSTSLSPKTAAAAALDLVQSASLDTGFLAPDTHPGLAISLAALERAARAVSEDDGKSPETAATKHIAFRDALNKAAEIATSISDRQVETDDARTKARALATRLRSLSGP